MLGFKQGVTSEVELSSELICLRIWNKIMTSMEDNIVGTNFIKLRLKLAQAPSIEQVKRQ
jgi:hypothetical protein